MIDLYKGAKFCNLSTEKCPKTTWKLDKAKFHTPRGNDPVAIMPPCCEKHIREVIFYTADLLEKNGIPYWMDFGTLLGAVRYSDEGGRIIPYDTDGDFCVFLSDRDKILNLKQRIYSDGFFLQEHHYTEERALIIHGNTVVRICRSEKNRNQIDLFFWKSNDYNNTLTSNGLNADKTFPNWFVKERFPIPFYGKPIMAPREPEAFLKMRFGRTWKTPQNIKVHGEDARETHKFGFVFAAKNGWSRKVKL